MTADGATDTRGGAANIYDVAQRAGVSHQTVSRVINNHVSVRAETRQRVLDAMDELAFVPNRAARSLVTSKTGLIGILASDMVLYGPAGGVHAMEIAAREAGYSAITRTVNPESEDDVRAGVQQLRMLGVEGMVVVTTHNRPTVIAREMLPQMPIVGIDSEFGAHELAVVVDNVDAAMRATRHLIDLGHTGILHITGPDASFVAKQRIDGYCAAMRAAHLTPHIEHADWAIASGYRIGCEFDFGASAVTAVFCANDAIAVGLMKALRERGLAVPERVSIVGFDDIPEAPYLDPALTTMRQEFAEIGRTAMTLLVRRLSGDADVASAFVKLEFHVRDSTAPAAR